MHLVGFESVQTGKKYPIDAYPYIVTDEGPQALQSALYDYDGIKKSLPNSLLSPKLGMFRYMPFLPISPDAELPNVMVGMTPLVPVKREKSPFPSINLYIKDEGREPSASFKDRASALVCVKAKELGKSTITTASSGNAAAATSVMAACLGLKCVIFIPAHAPPAKVLQNRLFGSRVVLVEGPYDNAVNACMRAAEKHGWYNRSTGFNPYTVEGKKTVSFEICEQFGSLTENCEWGKFKAPDVVVVSVGDGNIVSGVHKGLKELKEAGLIEKVPRIVGVQTEGCNPIYKCFIEKGDPFNMEEVETNTIADSIACGKPNDPVRAYRAAVETGGAYVEVREKDILNAIVEMARSSGVFGEPAAATAWAGVRKAIEEGYIKDGENVVMISTGNGLKDIAGATKAMEGRDEPERIGPNQDV